MHIFKKIEFFFVQLVLEIQTVNNLPNSNTNKTNYKQPQP